MYNMEYDDYDPREDWEDEIHDIISSVVAGKCADINNKNRTQKDTIESLREDIKVLKQDIRVVERENNFTQGMDKFKNRVNKDNIFNFINSLGFLKTNGDDYIRGMNSEKIPDTTKLILMYYNDREFIFDMFDLFSIKYTISRDFILPRSYDKVTVIEILRDISSRMITVNGCYFKDNFGSWGLKSDQVPLQDLFMNPFIKHKDCMNIILGYLDDPYYSYLLEVTNYQEIDYQDILKLGNCIPEVAHKNLRDYQRDFIARHKDLLFRNEQFCNKYSKYMDNNKYNTFAVHNFPLEYQIEFLKKFSLDGVVAIINKLNMTDEQKKDIIKSII